MKIKKITLILCGFLSVSPVWAQNSSEVVEWSAEQITSIQKVIGQPQVVETKLGPAVYFDGKSGVFLDENPLQGLKQLTIEVIFKPDWDGEFAQRFMHLGEVMGERIMFETRVNPDQTWYFDAYTKTPKDEGLVLIDENLLHPTDQWYNATLVVHPTMLVSYVNGTPQKWGNMEFQPITKGISSVGVRQNLVDYFKGTIYKIRITPKALVPRDFMQDYKLLNGD